MREAQRGAMVMMPYDGDDEKDGWMEGGQERRAEGTAGGGRRKDEMKVEGLIEEPFGKLHFIVLSCSSRFICSITAFQP